jgi:hypothetical protein
MRLIWNYILRDVKRGRYRDKMPVLKVPSFGREQRVTNLQLLSYTDIVQQRPPLLPIALSKRLLDGLKLRV